MELEQEGTSYERRVDTEQSGVAIRECYLSKNTSWLSQKLEWAGLQSIGCVRRTLEKLNGETAVDTRYFIASITEAVIFVPSVRGHGEVENKLHWQLDFTIKDEQNTTMEKHEGRNLQTMKRVVPAILPLVQPFYKEQKSLSIVLCK